MFPADEIYNCICTSPYDRNDITWSQYSKEQCAVSDELELEFHCSLFHTPMWPIPFPLQFQFYNGTLVGSDCDQPEPMPNVFLMSVILFFGTFITSVILKDFKNALFFPSKVWQNSILFHRKSINLISIHSFPIAMWRCTTRFVN